MNKIFDLSNKKAIVTGGGSGIGKAISMALARNGAEVLIFDLNLDAADVVAMDINSQGGMARAFQCDVSDKDSVIHAFEQSMGQNSLHILA